MQRASGEWDVARRSRTRLGGCSLLALHHAKLTALLPAPLHEQQPPSAVPCAGSGPAVQGSISAGTGEEVAVPGWAGEGGSGCHHGWDTLGIRQSQQYLEGCFALEVNFEPQSLHSRCHDFCWSWKINLKSSVFQSEELALLEASLHAPNLSIELSSQIFANSCSSSKTCLECGPDAVPGYKSDPQSLTGSVYC